MKTKLKLLTIALFCSLSLSAQTKQEVFSSIQKLVDKASGEKLKSDNVFAKKEDKLGKQIFTEKMITVNTIPGGKSDYQWVSRYTDIPWNDFFDYGIYTEFKNGNLQIVELKFKETFKHEFFISDEERDEKPDNYSSLKFYVLTKDEKELAQLLTRIYDFKEKKAESEFNKEIAKFSKEQTISWLTEKLKKNIAGDSYTTTITLVNFDACNLVFEYSNMVGRKYKETIPTAIELINKYNQFTYYNNICISKSYAFGMIQDEDETSYKMKSFLNLDTTDEDLISNIEFAMKHLADFCSGKIAQNENKPELEKESAEKKVSNSYYPTMEEIDAFMKTKVTQEEKKQDGESSLSFIGMEFIDAFMLQPKIEEFNGGKRDPDFLYDLAINAIKVNKKDAGVYVKAYYKTQKNLMTAKTIDLMHQFVESPLSDEFIFLQKNENEAEKLYPNNSISEKLDAVVLEYAIQFNNENQPRSITTENIVLSVEKTILRFRPQKAFELKNRFGMQITKETNEHELFEKYTLAYLDKNYKNQTLGFLNDTAWRFFEHSNNIESLEKALKWAIESVSKSSNFHNNDTVANLYYKLGDKNNARIYAEIAIKLGKETGKNTASTEALFEKLK
jgi:hypothetical protein